MRQEHADREDEARLLSPARRMPGLGLFELRGSGESIRSKKWLRVFQLRWLDTWRLNERVWRIIKGTVLLQTETVYLALS